MKNLLLATILIGGGALAGAALTSTLTHQANAATPADAGPPGPPWASGGMHPPGPPGPWGMGGMGGMDPHGGPPGMMDHHHDAAFSLFAHVDNKNLSAADIRIIAQAALLEHGNHSWTVTAVAPSGQNIDFSYATAHGDIIATFAVNPATGHIQRVS